MNTQLYFVRQGFRGLFYATLMIVFCGSGAFAVELSKPVPPTLPQKPTPPTTSVPQTSKPPEPEKETLKPPLAEVQTGIATPPTPTTPPTTKPPTVAPPPVTTAPPPTTTDYVPPTKLRTPPPGAAPSPTTLPPSTGKKPAVTKPVPKPPEQLERPIGPAPTPPTPDKAVAGKSPSRDEALDEQLLGLPGRQSLRELPLPKKPELPEGVEFKPLYREYRPGDVGPENLNPWYRTDDGTDYNYKEIAEDLARLLGLEESRRGAEGRSDAERLMRSRLITVPQQVLEIAAIDVIIQRSKERQRQEEREREREREPNPIPIQLNPSEALSPSAWGGGPSSDYSSDPMNPGGRGEQREVVRTPGGGQQGGPTIGPQPGQGGTLTGQGGRRQGGEGGTLRGRSQKGDGGNSPGFGGWGDGGGVRGGNDGGNDDAPENPAETRTDRRVGVPTGAYRKETGPSYSYNDSYNEGENSNDSESQTSGGSDTGKKGKDKTGMEGLGPSESGGDVKEIPITGLPAGDPVTGRGKDGDDLGGGKIGKYKVKGKTQQEIDLVGPAFGTTTGPDDKERPATGATSGTVAGDPSESRADDVGGRNMVGRSGGGQVDVEAGVELLKRLGLWKPGEGPKEQPRPDR